LPQSASITFATPPAAAAPLGRYSHLVVVPPNASLLVLAGQTGHAPNGHLPACPVDQYRGALRNVLAILASQDLGPESIIKLNSWVVGDIDFAPLAAVRRELLGDVRPATTVAFVSRLFTTDILVEVEVWAASVSTADCKP
jgi:ribosomal-protein-alanine N-acetyltransferase